MHIAIAIEYLTPYVALIKFALFFLFFFSLLVHDLLTRYIKRLLLSDNTQGTKSRTYLLIPAHVSPFISRFFYTFPPFTSFQCYNLKKKHHKEDKQKKKYLSIQLFL